MSRIYERIYVRLTISLASPLCIGGYQSINSDHDVIRGFDGKPFVPGSSLAGVFRGFLNEKDADNYFGAADQKGFVQSSIVVSDGIFQRLKISLRDGVMLNEFKTAENQAKYDYEIIETGSVFSFFIESAAKDEQESRKIRILLQELIDGMNNGHLRLGYKTNRGLGRLYVQDVKVRLFHKNDLEDWLNFNPDEMDTAEDELTHSPLEYAAPYRTLRAEARLTGGISIRRYSEKPDEPDFCHIQCNKQPVIPGSSLAGAVCSRARLLLMECGIDKSRAEKALKSIMGFIGDNDEEGRASDVIFEESVIKDSTEMDVTRTAIDRFTGSAANGALFSERANFTGHTTFSIMIKNEVPGWFLGLMMFVFEDIRSGLLAIGGQTSIGRGIFDIGEITLDGEKLDETAYSKEFADFVLNGDAAHGVQ